MQSCVDGVQFAMTTGDYEKVWLCVHKHHVPNMPGLYDLLLSTAPVV